MSGTPRWMSLNEWMSCISSRRTSGVQRVATISDAIDRAELSITLFHKDIEPRRWPNWPVLKTDLKRNGVLPCSPRAERTLSFGSKDDPTKGNAMSHSQDQEGLLVARRRVLGAAVFSAGAMIAAAIGISPA